MTSASDFQPSKEGWILASENGFSDAVAELWIKRTGDDLSVGMSCEDRHGNGNGTMHGGMICTLADIGLGNLVSLRRNLGQPPEAPRIMSATIQLNVSFCGRIESGDFVYSKAVINSMTRSMTFTQGELCIGNRTVAIMQGVFKVVGNKRA